MKKKKIFKTILTIIIVSALITSGAIFIQKATPQKEEKKESHEYNGFWFDNYGPLWVTEIQRGMNIYIISLRHSARELENIQIEGSLAEYGKTTTKKGATYLILDDWDVNDGQLATAVNEIGQQFNDVIGEKVITACSVNDTKKCYNFSQVICEESELGALYLTFGNETKITANGNCVKITGQNSTEIVKATERLFYHWYGIIK